MNKINYKSDFDFVLTLLDGNGRDLGFPSCDWVARLRTAMSVPYVASSVGGVLTNCFNDEGRIHIVADNHGLAPGKLSVEFELLTPNDMYPDGDKKEVIPQALDITLVREATEDTGELTAEVALSVIRDTDVYAEVLKEIGDIMQEELYGSGVDIKPSAKPSETAAVGLGNISLYTDYLHDPYLHIEGHKPYLEAGYIPLLFRFGKFTSAQAGGHRRFNGMRCYGQRYNCGIDLANNTVGRRAPNDGHYLDPHDYPDYWEAQDFINIRTMRDQDGEEHPYASNGNRFSVNLDSTRSFIFEFAFAFVRNDIPNNERITERHCVSNIVPFGVAYGDSGFKFTTLSLHRASQKRIIFCGKIQK